MRIADLVSESSVAWFCSVSVDRNEKVIQVTIGETVLGLKLFCPKRDSKSFRKIF